jgi:beta-glucosidase/6-phospho-beta-glucosidase/beta-galactosidase
MIYVDYRTQRRIWKDSGRWYQHVIEDNGQFSAARPR